MENTEKQNLAAFLSEIQMLKRLKHIGINLAGAEAPDSIADHVCISAQIAYILAYFEGADPEKCAAINLFHDNHEARIGDQNKVSSRYIDTKQATLSAENDQLANLPSDLQDKISLLLQQKHERKTKEGIVAQDADWLEQAIHAKTLLERGYQGCQIWIDNVEVALETDSAKEILKVIVSEPDFINCWWPKIQKMTYQKLNNLEN